MKFDQACLLMYTVRYTGRWIDEITYMYMYMDSPNSVATAKMASERSFMAAAIHNGLR